MGGLVNIGLRSEGLTDSEYLRHGMTKLTLSASTYSVLSTSTYYLVFDGTTDGQIIQLPDATTVKEGHSYWVVNDSATSPIEVRYYDNVTELITLPPNSRTHIVAKAVSTTNGEWIVEQSTSSALSSTSFLTYYGGNANTGRILQYVPGEDTDDAPYLVVGNSAIVALSLGATSLSTGTCSVYLSTDLVNPITSIALTNQDANSTTGLYVQVNNEDELVVKVSAGTILKPYLTTYLVGR